MRIILVNLLLLILPFVLYYFYAKAHKPGMTFGEVFSAQPVMWLVAAGGLLMFTYIAFQIDFDGDARDGSYLPPRVENGKLLPGEVKPKDN